jgi:hypothetical protein
MFVPTALEYTFTGNPSSHWAIEAPYDDPPAIDKHEWGGWGSSIGALWISSVPLDEGTWPSLADHEWCVGDYGSWPGIGPLGFNTVYFRYDGGTSGLHIDLISNKFLIHEDGDFMFREWGIEPPLHGAIAVQLYPVGVGAYSQLKACSNGQYCDLPHWQCVNDPAEAPNEQMDYIEYNLFDYEGFLSGQDEYAAGALLFGTEVLWRTGPTVCGLWGVDTLFTVELEPGMLMTSRQQNEWYPTNWKRIAEIDTIESDTALTFKYMNSGSPDNQPSEVWFFTPVKWSDVYNKRSTPADGGGPPRYTRTACMHLTGTWSFNEGSKKVTGTGGAALSEIRPFTWLWPSPAHVGGAMVAYVTDNNTIYLWRVASSSHVGSEVCYCFYGQVDTV